MALSAAAIAAIESAASATASAASHIGGSYTSAKKSYKYSKKLAELSNNYNIAAFNRSKDWAKEIATNEVLWNKIALQNAGYSTANPEGVPYTAPSAASMDPAKVSQFSYPDLGTGLYNSVVSGLDTVLKAAQIKNINADTNKKSTENEQLKLDLQNYRDTYQERVDQIKFEFYNLTKQNQKLTTEIDNLAAATANIDVDTRFKEATFDMNKDKLFEELQGLIKDNKVKEIEAKLADYGIILGASDIGTILSIAASDKGAEASEMFGKFIGSVVGAIPRALGQMLKALWDEATK